MRICTEYWGSALADRFGLPHSAHGTSVWRLNSRPLWDCGLLRQTSITAGHLDGQDQLPLRVWFLGGLPDEHPLPRLAALQLGRSVSTTRPPGLLSAKLRRAMVNPDRAISRAWSKSTRRNPFPPGIRRFVSVVGMA